MLLAVLLAALTTDVTPNARMLRYADVSATHVVFVYADDLWLVPREGGTATPLASPPGAESFPRFSPDGSQVAFVGNYEGNRDLYVLPVAGGVSARVTHHPYPEQLCDWTADGKLLFASSHEADLGGRQQQLFTVPPTGGLPQRLPVPYGGNGSLSSDGRMLAYVPIPFDFRTWKRYAGGTAMDVWLFDTEARTSRRVTTWEGSDSLPMWHGSHLYYLSDAGASHLLNIWSFDPATGAHEQATDLASFDVKWPSMGPGQSGQGEIVFQHGGDLLLLDLATRRTRSVPVTIPGDRPTIRPRQLDAGEFIEAWGVSSTGQRALVEARGDIWTLPATEGAPRNLTASDDAADRDPSWSPDGRWVACVSDRDGEYELWLLPSDGKGAPRQLTDGHQFVPGRLSWSPAGERLAFTDHTGALWTVEVESGELHQVDKDPWAVPPDASWSHDGGYLVYTKNSDAQLSALWMYEVDSRATAPITSGRFRDSSPVFDRKGDFLYFVSNRDWSAPLYEDLGTTFVYAGTGRIYAVPLRADMASPFLPESDEELWGDAKKEKEKEEKEDEDAEEEEEEEGEEEPGPPERVHIDFDGFESRAILLPVERGNLGGLQVTHDGKLVYARAEPYQGEDEGPAVSVRLFDPAGETEEDLEEKTLVEEADEFALSADGKLLLVVHEGKASLRKPEPEAEDEPVPLDSLLLTVDPRDEWREMFIDSWRRFRDYFYARQMHGVDWEAVRARYEPLLADCASREDLSFLIREMISELNVGHAYYNVGEQPEQPDVDVGLLGCDFELYDGTAGPVYKITRIVRGAPWDADARGPLGQPGAVVQEGEFLLAVNGVPVDAARDPWAAFQGLADKTVALTIGGRSVIDDLARQVLVEPVANDGELRYRAWVEKNRAYVDQVSSGRVAYVHVPDTGIRGQNELFRQFYGQIHLPALIVDERWNGGGQVPTRFIELLDRPATNYWSVPFSRTVIWPPDSHQGPKCMLINQRAGSGGDAFPYYFRQAGLGPLIGMRTWGGLVGISDLPPLLDGASVSVPGFAFYELDGTWGVEGYGVAPDIEVVDDPALMQDGKDPQLDKAIEVMLTALTEHPWTAAPEPPFPDRRGMLVPEADR